MTKSTAPRYDHTQHGKIHYLLWALGVALLVGGLTQVPGDTRAVLTVTGTIMLAVTPLFAWLRVRDTGEALRVGYGPLALFRRNVPYDQIIAFQPRRTPLIHGLGIHGVPGIGWTWNLWGRDCVTLTLRKDGHDSILNVGTDDQEGLARHLSETLDARLRDAETDVAA